MNLWSATPSLAFLLSTASAEVLRLKATTNCVRHGTGAAVAVDLALVGLAGAALARRCCLWWNQYAVEHCLAILYSRQFEALQHA